MWLSFEALFRMLRVEAIRLVLPPELSSLHQRLIEEMQMRQLAPKTREQFSPMTFSPMTPCCRSRMIAPDDPKCVEFAIFASHWRLLSRSPYCKVRNV